MLFKVPTCSPDVQAASPSESVLGGLRELPLTRWERWGSQRVSTLPAMRHLQSGAGVPSSDLRPQQVDEEALQIPGGA